ncbi:MAG: hypothetical protein INH41_02045 [Myxococcaceae bacterium]|jgi:hypothetical protein|nr:hypothetical protein [Myxococcaceae bacterium]
MVFTVLSLVLAQAQLAPAPSEPLDFSKQAKVLFRVVACAGDEPVPAHLDARVVEAHCKELRRRIEKYRKTWVGEAMPFLQSLKPAGLPTTVVYPFGGGDLISALTTYPEATDITTMSLEHAGDPRRIDTITSKQLAASLALVRATSAGLLTANDSKTENLMKGQRGELPGQLSFFLIGLAVHGFEPVSLRYVKANADGSLRALTATDLSASEVKQAKLLHQAWMSPDFSEAFDNLELVFVKKGADPKTQARVHRHFAQNLSDTNFGQDTGMRKYLEQKGRIVAMTKAASYLLWRDHFSVIRDYLLAHMEFMVSDSTGIPPRFAKAAGFEQQAFGRFTESFLGANPQYNEDFRALWKTAKPLAFRYGYLDKQLSKHMLVTRRAPAAAAP